MVSTRKVAASDHVCYTTEVATSDYVCFSHMTEVAALEEDMQEYLDKVSVLVAGGMLVVSIPSALSVGLQVLDYCTADPSN